MCKTCPRLESKRSGAARPRPLPLLARAMGCAVLLSLGACASLNPRERDTAVGAAVGGVAGSILTGGSTVGTVGGAVLGGVIGSRAEPQAPRDSHRDRRDRRHRGGD